MVQPSPPSSPPPPPPPPSSLPSSPFRAPPPLPRLPPQLVHEEDPFQAPRTLDEEDPGDRTLGTSVLARQLPHWVGQEDDLAQDRGDDDESRVKHPRPLGMKRKGPSNPTEDDDERVNEASTKAWELWVSPMTDQLLCTPFVYPMFFFLLFFIQVHQTRWTLFEEMSRLKLKFQSGCVQVHGVVSALEQWPGVYALHLQSEAETLLKSMVQHLGAMVGFSVSLGQHILFMLVSSQTMIYKCLASTVLTSSTRFLLDMVKTLQEGWNTVVNELEQGFDTMLNTLNSQLADALGGVDFRRLFGNTIGTKVEVPNLRQFSQSLQIPMGFTFDLEEAMNNMPSFETMYAAFEKVLKTPFQLLQSNLDQSIMELQNKIQLNLNFTSTNPLDTPPTFIDIHQVCDEVRLTQALTNMQMELDQWFLYTLYALMGVMGLCLLVSMVQVYVRHVFTIKRMQQLRQTQKSELIWEMLDPITFKLMHWMDQWTWKRKGSFNASKRNLTFHPPPPFTPPTTKNTPELNPSLVKTKSYTSSPLLSWTTKRKVARCIRFFSNKPAMVFLLFSCTTLLFYYVQLGLIQTWKSQPELVFNPMHSVLSQVSDEVRQQTLVRLDNLYETSLLELNNLTQTLAQSINVHFLHQFMDVIESINATMASVTQQMLDLVDATFAPVPAIQVTLTDLLHCFVLQRTQWFQELITSLVRLTTFSFPLMQRPSTHVFDEVIQKASDGWKDTSTGWLVDFLTMYESKVLKQIEYTWYMTAFALGPTVCGCMFMIYTSFFRQRVPPKKTFSTRSFSSSFCSPFLSFFLPSPPPKASLYARCRSFWQWHAQQWSQKKKSWFQRVCFVSFVLVMSPMYLCVFLWTCILYVYETLLISKDPPPFKKEPSSIPTHHALTQFQKTKKVIQKSDIHHPLPNP
ncbi:hypothetical protein HMI54_012737 [Coelomomyces lativittatus]|nr:hypothetical protein HMI56_007554 [Coelomomyces lativittatus]KAJ1515203.1 hypothetical protein HMI54_012737 [Coelomomyces lativittatus]KAJ1516982.1 hypothetical protein HMI55_000918 [Coelomomyces lativittatus]